MQVFSSVTKIRLELVSLILERVKRFVFNLPKARSDGDFMLNIAKADIKQSVRLVVRSFTDFGIWEKTFLVIFKRPAAESIFFSLCCEPRFIKNAIKIIFG